MNEYLETLRIRAAAGDEDAGIELALQQARLTRENQQQIRWAEQRGYNWSEVNGVVRVDVDLSKQGHP